MTPLGEKVKALLNRTVENGCTEHEEATSVSLALKIIEREAMPHSRFEFPPRYSVTGVRLPEGQLRVRPQAKPQERKPYMTAFGRTFWSESEFRDFLRRATAEADAKAKAQAKAKPQQQQTGGGARKWKSIGDIIIAMVGMTNADGSARWTYTDILHNVRKHFPGAKTTTISVRWYESKLRKEGVKIPKRKEQK